MRAGYALGRSRAQAVVPLLVAVAALLAASSAPARAERPPTEHLVAPAGTELVTHDGGAAGAVAGDFLKGYDDLDVTVVDGAVGAIRDSRDLAVMISVVRLTSEEEAAEALAALGRPTSTEELLADPMVAESMLALDAVDPSVEPLPAPSHDVEARRAVTSSSYSVVEFARATGRDLIVLAQLDGSREPVPIMHAALDGQRAAPQGS